MAAAFDPAAAVDDDTSAQVKVFFTTTEQDADLQLPESKRPLIVPADIRRYGLSRILNSESMLATDRPVPFDFLVDGAYLRTTLEEYLRDNGISAETTVTLQYVRSLVPPVFEASFEHDDWVSSVDISPLVAGASGRLLSGSYDGLLRLWNAAGQVTTVSRGAAQGGHTAGVKAARFVTATHIASAGLDRTVRIWKYNAADDNEGGEDAVMADGSAPSSAPALLKPLLELYGHKGSIDSLAVDATSKRVLSASVDGAIGLWSISKSSAPAAPESLLPGAGSAAAVTNKKRKISSSSSGSASDVPRRGALSMIQAHKNAAATAAVFDPRDRTVAYSAGQDHALCTLDLTTGQVVSTVATSHALLSLCAVGSSKGTAGGSGSRLLAAGNAARNVVLVDPRASVATTAVMTLRGHVNKVVALAAAPDNEYSLVSASHDGTCRIWDLRSSRKAVDDDAAAAPSNGESTGASSNLTSISEAVYVIDREGREGKRRPLAGEGVKVFDVAWDKTWGIVSGGEDKRVQINRGRDVVAQS